VVDLRWFFCVGELGVRSFSCTLFFVFSSLWDVVSAASSFLCLVVYVCGVVCMLFTFGGSLSNGRSNYT